MFKLLMGSSGWLYYLFKWHRLAGNRPAFATWSGHLILFARVGWGSAACRRPAVGLVPLVLSFRCSGGVLR
jgi:hypothetical protein